MGLRPARSTASALALGLLRALALEPVFETVDVAVWQEPIPAHLRSVCFLIVFSWWWLG